MVPALLDAATELLEAEGPDALSVRRIAAMAKVAPMGVYNHFESKFGIVDALFRRGFEQLAAALEETGTVGDPYDALCQAGRSYRALAVAHPMVYRLMFMRSVPGYEPSEGALHAATSAFDALVAAVERAVSAGRLAEGPPADTAQVIWAAIHGWVSLELLGIGVMDAPDVGYERMCITVLRGLAP
ncbi:MAG TPA: TetR/AcrR family transcriptional regulator [Acidimicrobiales bacterium]|nr:TetR/AcrR family transcriptional regulator [Acidimicrobiales bacterium]